MRRHKRGEEKGAHVGDGRSVSSTDSLFMFHHERRAPAGLAREHGGKGGLAQGAHDIGQGLFEHRPAWREGGLLGGGYRVKEKIKARIAQRVLAARVGEMVGVAAKRAGQRRGHAKAHVGVMVCASGWAAGLACFFQAAGQRPKGDFVS